ncbi:Cell wall synthesis KRE9 [Lecanosticta acicola]|uniref:Cell wall synthesis KRE9 n=1 Tax=Lecanosticta acicola TaxID=111012 RepID=A0AAI8Z1N4_9PEZI|nr:Cell wall synthesis KRE9 [Lecanosticta acicola]
MRFSDLLFATLLLAPANVVAWVKFTSPAAGADLSTGSVTISWEDSGDSPSIDDLTTYTLQLMVGGNSDSNSLALTTITSTGTFSSGNSVKGTIVAGSAGPTANGFYFKMTSVAKEGGTIENYSDRFSIPSMTGTTPSEYETAAKAVSGTAGPDTVNNVANDAAAADTTAAGTGEFTVPYALQTGLTKYAPMQKVPPTKITMKNFTPMYSTSAYTIATTWLGTPTIQTTITASQTFSVVSQENTAAAQSQPTGDMAKFLARWKD